MSIYETIGRRLRRYADKNITPNHLELIMAADAELWAEIRIRDLEKRVMSDEEYQKMVAQTIDLKAHVRKLEMMLVDAHKELLRLHTLENALYEIIAAVETDDPNAADTARAALENVILEKKE